MSHYQSNQDFYDDIDIFVFLLRDVGLISEAEKINHLLHKMAWTTSSELLGELRNTFRDIASKNGALSMPIKTELNLFINTINSAFGQANEKL